MTRRTFVTQLFPDAKKKNAFKLKAVRLNLCTRVTCVTHDRYFLHNVMEVFSLLKGVYKF